MKFTRQEMIFNGAFAFMFAGVVIYMVRDGLVTTTVEPCSQRYDALTEFTLDNGVGPMSVVQLVGHIGTSQRGVYNNAKVVKVRGVDSEHAVKVRLNPDDGDKNGIRFRWSPRNLDGATAACLSYSVYLPKEFEFGAGGFLPGLFTGEQSQQGVSSDVDGSVTQRVEWEDDGRGALAMHSKADGQTKRRTVGRERFDLPKGRWVSIEQELVMNKESKNKGRARVYVGGEMVLDKELSNLPGPKKFAIGGVRGDIGYADLERIVRPPENVNKMYVSQMKLRWE